MRSINIEIERFRKYEKLPVQSQTTRIEWNNCSSTIYAAIIVGAFNYLNVVATKICYKQIICQTKPLTILSIVPVAIFHPV
jgi:hypothetical protein